jgi:hypothetical protein
MFTKNLDGPLFKKYAELILGGKMFEIPSKGGVEMGT